MAVVTMQWKGLSDDEIKKALSDGSPHHKVLRRKSTSGKDDDRFNEIHFKQDDETPKQNLFDETEKVNESPIQVEITPPTVQINDEPQDVEFKGYLNDNVSKRKTETSGDAKVNQKKNKEKSSPETSEATLKEKDLKMV